MVAMRPSIGSRTEVVSATRAMSLRSSGSALVSAATLSMVFDIFPSAAVCFSIAAVRSASSGRTRSTASSSAGRPTSWSSGVGMRGVTGSPGGGRRRPASSPRPRSYSPDSYLNEIARRTR